MSESNPLWANVDQPVLRFPKGIFRKLLRDALKSRAQFATLDPEHPRIDSLLKMGYKCEAAEKSTLALPVSGW